MSYTVVIIGGYGGMGQIFVKIFRDYGWNVIITGPNKEKGEKIANDFRVKFSDDNRIAMSADITIITVPIEKTIATIKEVAPLVRDGSLIIDFTSVKTNICDALLKYANKNAEIISIHPMFGPTISGIHGQIFILCLLRTEKWLSIIEKFLNHHKAKFVTATPEEHDKAMSVIQGLTHFTYISIGYTLKNMDFNVKESRKFASPIYNLMLDIIGRILSQDPYLYAHIQMENPLTQEVRKKFIESANTINDCINSKDEKNFVHIMSSSAKHFSDLSNAVGRSNKAIASLHEELEFLKNNIGKEIFVRHANSRKIHFGNIHAIDAENLELENKTTCSKFKIANIEILNDVQEILNVKNNVLGITKKDFTVLLEEGIDETLITEILNYMKYELEIDKVCIKDIYRSEKFKNNKSVCYEISFVNRDMKTKEAEVRKFLSRIGKLR
ncbi:MAG: prephenate dehydrogenase/arogenate dehydrogenase family protein [Candidatus Altarchaeum sp.]|nr:prephenate dehydrogenase/arogenate dehydrogenase family protein [Candidatus Altarchaeum sp.]